MFEVLDMKKELHDRMGMVMSVRMEGHRKGFICVDMYINIGSLTPSKSSVTLRPSSFDLNEFEILDIEKKGDA